MSEKHLCDKVTSADRKPINVLRIILSPKGDMEKFGTPPNTNNYPLMMPLKISPETR